MKRRHFTGLAIVGGIAALAPKCSGPRLDSEIAIAQIAINTLTVIVPSVAPTANKVLQLLKDVDADAKAGDFSSAQAAFDNLATFITQLQDDAGIAVNDRAKLILVTILAAIRAIALLINNSKPANVALSPSVNRAMVNVAPESINTLLGAAKMKF